MKTIKFAVLHLFLLKRLLSTGGRQAFEKRLSFASSVVFLFASYLLSAQEYSLRNGSYEVVCKGNGTIIRFISNGKSVEFRNDTTFEGPSIHFSNIRIDLKNIRNDPDELIFSGDYQNMKVSLAYSFADKAFSIRTTVKNNSNKALPIEKLMLQLGVNTEMDVFPHWNRVYFPTMMRCEKDFFWGYLMNPEGGIITVVSPDPVASWNNSYKENMHRIFTTNLDLMHKLPLPDRHPQNLNVLHANEEKSWTVYLQPAKELQNVRSIVASLSKAAVIDVSQYTIGENETFQVQILGDIKELYFVTPDQRKIELKPSQTVDFTPANGVGKYKLIAKSISGKTSEAILSVRRPWTWYLKQARLNAIEQEQKGGSHTESWYGLFSMFLAQKYFPSDDLLKISLDKFNELYPLMYDEQDLPRKIIVFGSLDLSERIQNTACMASLLAVIYATLKDTSYLAKASRMCDFLITKQDKNGAYRSGGNIHYTSVVYIAKSILEVCQQEKLLATGNNVWQQRYDRHLASAKNAIDELAGSLDNIQTEGEMTYEDGMIACSYAQISMMATLTQNKADREKYIKAAEYLRNGHRCLSQLLIPDSRMNGGSLRYWESQYDILSFSNMMSSPHGWSAWRIYGLYYLYQLTGNPDLIEQIYNALGACVQLIDESTGVLRWAFCVDPYIKGDPKLATPQKKFGHDEMRSGNLFVKDTATNISENRGMRIDTAVGEQYLNMISSWYKAKPNTWVTGYWEQDGGCCDNDVHEIFKCLEETVLTNAFVVEQNDGSLRAYNCKLKSVGNTIEITPNENLIAKVHFNLRRNYSAIVHFSNKDICAEVKSGEMKWVKL